MVLGYIPEIPVGIHDKDTYDSLTAIRNFILYGGVEAGESTLIRDVPPPPGLPGNVGQFYYDTSTNNLYVFADGEWVPASLGYALRYLHVRYATNSSGTTGFTNDYTTLNTLSLIHI